MFSGIEEMFKDFLFKAALVSGFFLAERERFELSVATSTTTVFETAPLNHSGTSPLINNFLFTNKTNNTDLSKIEKIF